MHPEHDYFKAIALARKKNKPVLIDFTGYGCENCKKMEEFVWSEPDILPTLLKRSHSRFSLCRRQRRIARSRTNQKLDLETDK